MPEALLQKMSDDDIRALFHFLSSDQIVATAVPVEETLTNFEHRKWFSSLVNGHQGSPTTSPLIDTEEERCLQTGETLSIFDAVSNQKTDASPALFSSKTTRELFVIGFSNDYILRRRKTPIMPMPNNRAAKPGSGTAENRTTVARPLEALKVLSSASKPPPK